jgi:hypothetical protein
LIALTGLARTPLLAGFAANLCFSLVKGLIPSRAGRAGFLGEPVQHEHAGLLQLLVA